MKPKPFKLTPKYPSESQEQARVIRWALYRQATRPELKNLVSIPNGSRRDAATGAKLVREGLKAGVPDLALFVLRGGYGALFIEMKRRQGGRVRPEQADWHERLRNAGYAVAVCRGFDEAVKTIEAYLSSTPQELRQ